MQLKARSRAACRTLALNPKHAAEGKEPCGVQSTFCRVCAGLADVKRMRTSQVQAWGGKCTSSDSLEFCACLLSDLDHDHIRERLASVLELLVPSFG